MALSGTQLAISEPNDNLNGSHDGVVYLYDLATGNLLHTMVIPSPFLPPTLKISRQDIALSDDYVRAGAPSRNKGR